MALKDVLGQARSSLTQSQEENHQVNSRIEQTEKALEAALAREAEAAAKTKRAEEALAESRDQTARAEEALEAAAIECRAVKEGRGQLELELRTCRSSLETANLLRGAAEERADCAEEIARNLDAQLAEMKTKVAAVEARAATAVEDFRQSADYRKELADATAFAYDVGFQDCKDRAKIVRNVDLDELCPDELEDLANQPSRSDS